MCVSACGANLSRYLPGPKTLIRKYNESIKECEIALEMNPNHFGAWNGLGLCHYQLANYPMAIESFKTALSIQPFADFNKLYIARCRGQLN